MKIRSICDNPECFHEFILEAATMESIITGPVCPMCGSDMILSDYSVDRRVDRKQIKRMEVETPIRNTAVL